MKGKIQGDPTIPGPDVVWHEPELVFELLVGEGPVVVAVDGEEQPGPQSFQNPL